MNKDDYLRHREEITDWDQQTFMEMVSTDLSAEETRRILTPPFVSERESVVMALHWHPETVPAALIENRIDAMFPNRTEDLIIPTQHNELIDWHGFSGVEVDCYSREFNRKVQLLFHFESARLSRSDVFRSMLSHTYKYRATQFFDFLETLVNPKFAQRIEEAVAATEVEDDLVTFVQENARKFRMLVDRNFASIPEQSIKNKLIPGWFQELKVFFDHHTVNKAIVFLRAVKEVVKRNFVLTYFYETPEVIEEARGIGGGIVVPHPEQFWPILLADYDVDGYEVWNPQSREFTEFLIQSVVKKNKRNGRRQLLVFMGDDTHMGEKLKNVEKQDHEKASREIGFQPAWDEPGVQKSLVFGHFDKRSIIGEYRSRLTNPE